MTFINGTSTASRPASGVPLTRTGRFTVSSMVAVAVVASLGWARPAQAQRLKPIPHPVGALGPTDQQARSRITKPPPPPSSWTPLTNQPSFLFNGASNPMLLTDGTVLVQDAGFPDWWRLTPDAAGSYVNGTWSAVASLPASYSPLYHSSAVLPDGRLIIEGGEYLLDAAQENLIPSWTAQGAIYDPLANTWTAVEPPPFFTGFGPFAQTIGDAQSVVLADGTYMQANCCQAEAALLDPKTLMWSPTGKGKFALYDEEGWTLLPNKKVLTVDAYVTAYDPAGTASEIYDPTTAAWLNAGSTIQQLWDSAATCGGEEAASFEVGPAVLRPDGTVFYAGSNQCASGHTAIYNSKTGKWKAGPDFPDGVSIMDGPAALEPNGKVLMMASPPFLPPSEFFEWDGKELTEIAGPPNAALDASFFGNMLVLPTGEILLTDFSNDVEVYTPTAPGEREEEEIRPLVDSAPTCLFRGKTHQISGRGFNGVSQGAAYGDDVQAATNYPLVRLTNLKTGHVSYCRTHDHSSMSVASRETVFTRFDVSPRQERGRSKLEVVANGVASCPISVLVE
jgi:hypothetical protein